MLTPSIETFITEPYLIGQDVKFRPIQKEILYSFWNNPYTMGIWCLGRRSGKTFCAAASAVYACTALAPIYKSFIRKNEQYHVLFVANNEEQAKIALDQVKIFLNSSIILKKLVKSSNATSVNLTNGAIFKAVPNTAKGVRGYSVALAIFDEAAHYRTGYGEQTGEQLYQAIAPSIAQFGNYGRLLMISTPWTKQGIFYDNYQKGLSGEYPEIHTANYPTWEVNPTITQEFLASAKKRDPIMFEVEYGANFSVDFAAFLDIDKIREAVVLNSCLPPNRIYKNKYLLALDPALSGDAFTAAIAHLEGSKLVIDQLHEFIPTFNQGNKRVVDISQVEDWIMRQHDNYGFSSVVLDQFQSASTIQRLSHKLGSRIKEFTWTHNSKILAYGQLKELFNLNQIAMFPHDKAISQLSNLQVHYTKSGSWTVSGGSGVQVDDYCSVLAALAFKSKEHTDVAWSKYA
jgi:hypothetical protein